MLQSHPSLLPNLKCKNLIKQTKKEKPDKTIEFSLSYPSREMNLVNYVVTSGTFFNMLIFHHWFLGKLKSLFSISMASLKLNKQSKAVKSTKEINISSKKKKRWRTHVQQSLLTSAVKIWFFEAQESSQFNFHTHSQAGRCWENFHQEILLGSNVKFSPLFSNVCLLGELPLR